MSRRALLSLCFVCALIVVWVRLLPLALGGVEAPAERAARAQVLRRVAPGAGALPRREWEARADEWIRRNASEHRAQVAAFSERFRDMFRYTADNGKTYAYLGDYDSYAWVRLARNFLRHGNTCDAVVDGLCRDTLVNAPHGAELIYNRSLHITAIVILQWFLQRFDPQYPLTATAYWIPLIVGVLGVLPAFWMGYRLAGPVAAVGAALLIALHPVVLQRSIGSDNDSWNVVLPLYMFASAFAGLLADRTPAQVGWALLAGIFAGLHAATWSGWVFTWAVLLVALSATILAQLFAAAIEYRRSRAVAHGSRQSRRKPSHQTQRAAAASFLPTLSLWPSLRAPLSVLVTFYVAAGVSATLARPETAYLSAPWNALGSVLSRAFLGENRAELQLWPSVLNTVSELQVGATLDMAFPWAFGRLYFAASLIGLWWVMFPAAPWSRLRLALWAGGALWLATVANLGGASLLSLLAAAVPWVPAALARAISADPEERRLLAPHVIVAVWFLAGLFAAFHASRLILLFSPGIGFALALGLGRLHRLVSTTLEGLSAHSRSPVPVLLAVLVSLPFVAPVHAGYLTARNYLPYLNDAWWDSLTTLRERASPDAIVHTWWDYGYWVKYVAERRVSADGSMLLTHLPYWTGRSLLSTTEREAAGLLRMLGCGSDATPLAEGERGAYGLIHAKLGDPIHTQSVVVELANRSRADAGSYLTEQGFEAGEVEAVLAATHCDPPESYLLVDTELTAKDSWMRLGAWDFRRSYVYARAADGSESDVVSDITQRFGYGVDEARALYTDARRLGRVEFVIGATPRAPSVWYSCRPGSPGIMRCPIGLFDLASRKMVDELVYHVHSPGRSVVRYRHAEPGRPPGAVSEQPPGALLVADAVLTDVNLPTPRYSEAAFLLDTRTWRVLVGPPLLIRSTFTHLLFLDGRYARHFEKVDERVTHTEGRLQTWRLRFPED